MKPSKVISNFFSSMNNEQIVSHRWFNPMNESSGDIYCPYESDRKQKKFQLMELASNLLM